MSELREALSGAFEEAESNDAPVTDSASVDVAPATSSVASPGDDGATTATDAPAPSVADDGRSALERSRDEKGRFAAKQAKAVAQGALALGAPPTPSGAPGDGGPAAGGTAQPVAGQQSGTQPPTPGATDIVKAPQSLTPQEREAFAKASPDVQQIIMRREKDVARALQESAPARRLQEAFAQTTAPYQQFMQSAGMDPMRAFGSFLDVTRTLRTGPAEQRASVVADIIKNFGVDVEQLAAALDGQPQQARQQSFDPDAIARQVEARFVQNMQQRQQQALSHQATQTVEEFVQSAPEFFEDVREEIADLMELRARRGVKLELKDAYNHVIRNHPEIGPILKQREAATAANATQASTQRARAASSSVRSQPSSAPVGGREPESIRDYLEAAASSLSGR